MRGLICAWKDTDDVRWPCRRFSIIDVMNGEFRLVAVVDSLCGAGVNLALAFVDVGAVVGHCQRQSI